LSQTSFLKSVACCSYGIPLAGRGEGYEHKNCLSFNFHKEFRMAKEKYEETQFRIGAAHAAAWFWQVSKQMTMEGKTSQEISERLGDLSEVLADWRNNWTTQNVALPSEDNPWEWKAADLNAFISKRKPEW
jgi:hypothetical protein